MKTTYTSLPFAGHTLHFAEFDPASFREQGLFWLPHHAQPQYAGHKRRIEHLAGRIAAIYTLWEYGYKCVSATGELCQPMQPMGIYSSISHCGTTALAVAFRQPVGIDIGETFFARIARELTDNIITPAERKRFADCGLAFPLALTLVFSAKESAFRASEIQAVQGFLDYQIISWNKQQITIRLEDEQFVVHWQIKEETVMTLCQHD